MIALLLALADLVNWFFGVLLLIVGVLFAVEFVAYVYFKIASSVRGYLLDYRADRPIGRGEKEKAPR